MKVKKALLLVLCVIGGVVLGAYVAELCADIPSISWLAFSRGVGISPQAPFVLDLSIFEFSFAFSINVSIAQVITVSLAVCAYNLIVKKWK